MVSYAENAKPKGQNSIMYNQRVDNVQDRYWRFSQLTKNDVFYPSDPHVLYFSILERNLENKNAHCCFSIVD